METAAVVRGGDVGVPRTFESAGSSVPRMQHSPSRATNPESLQVQRDFKFRERLREDVRGHFFSRAVLDLEVRVGDGLVNKVETDVDVFRARVVVVFGCEVYCGLVVAE